VSTVRRSLSFVFLLAGLLWSALPAQAQSVAGKILELELDGVVDPFVANYLVDGIEQANADGATAVLVTIDTPGGLDSAMREITQAILNSKVPVIGYVSPSGARAASAGTFILLSTSVAAMAPATNVGAAEPVGLSGAVASEKAVNDAAEYIVSIADARDRNAAWAESAVRSAESISAERALELGVIEVIAPDVPTLLAEIDGWTVPVAGGEVTLNLDAVPIQKEEPGFFIQLLHTLMDPNVAFIFFWLGLALIAIEFFVPGGIAGTIGAIMLLLSLVALGMLPVQLVGVGLLVASVVFFVLELMHPGVGVPAVAAVVCLLLGGWFLFDASGGVRVSPLVIVPVAALAAFFFLFVVRSAIRLRRQGAVTRDETLAGRDAVVLQDLVPTGVVRIGAEEWSAISIRGNPVRGDRVRIVAVEGLKLKVEPADEPAEAVTGDGKGDTRE
jgi:membrane-bound serine protease (ClpP class)